jgi:hypothetical protein
MKHFSDENLGKKNQNWRNKYSKCRIFQLICQECSENYFEQMQRIFDLFQWTWIIPEM